MKLALLLFYVGIVILFVSFVRVEIQTEQTAGVYPYIAPIRGK